MLPPPLFIKKTNRSYRYSTPIGPYRHAMTTRMFVLDGYYAKDKVWIVAKCSGDSNTPGKIVDIPFDPYNVIFMKIPMDTQENTTPKTPDFLVYEPRFYEEYRRNPYTMERVQFQNPGDYEKEKMMRSKNTDLYSTYDPKPGNTTVRTAFSHGIRFYQWYKTIDLTPIRCAEIEQQPSAHLKIGTIAIHINSDRKYVVPSWSKPQKSIMSSNPIFKDHIMSSKNPSYLFPTTPIQRIDFTVHKNINDQNPKKYTFTSPEREYAMIDSFLNDLIQEDCDVIAIFNVSKLYYLYHRILHFPDSKELLTKFIAATNRLGHSTEKRAETRMFPRWNQKYEIQSECLANYSNYSAETERYTGTTTGRILFQCWSRGLLHKSKLYRIDPDSTQSVFNAIKTYGLLDLVLNATGELSLTHNYFTQPHMIMLHCILAESKDIYFPIKNDDNSSKTTHQISTLQKKGGGISYWDDSIRGWKKTDENEELLISDFKSCYPNIIVRHELSPELLASPEEWNDNEINWVPCDKANTTSTKINIPFLKPKVGQRVILRDAVRRLLDIRSTLQRQMESQILSPAERESLNTKQTAVKLWTNTFYGKTGSKWTSNYFFCEEVSNCTTTIARSILTELKEKLEKSTEHTLFYGVTDSLFMITSNCGSAIDTIKKFERKHGVVIDIDNKLKAIVPISRTTWIGITKDNVLINKNVIRYRNNQHFFEFITSLWKSILLMDSPTEKKWKLACCHALKEYIDTHKNEDPIHYFPRPNEEEYIGSDFMDKNDSNTNYYFAAQIFKIIEACGGMADEKFKRVVDTLIDRAYQ